MIMERLAAEARRLLAADLAYIATRRDDGTFRIDHVSGVALTDLVGSSFDADTGLAGEVSRTGRPLHVFDYASSRAFAHGRLADEIGEREGVASMLAVPATSRAGGPDGIVCVIHRTPTRISTAEVELALVIADHAATCFDTAALLETQRQRVDALEDLNAELDRRDHERSAESTWTTHMIEVVAGGGGVPEILATLATEGCVASYLPSCGGSPETVGPAWARDEDVRHALHALPRDGRHGATDVLAVGRADRMHYIAHDVGAGGHHFGRCLLLSVDELSGDQHALLRRATPVLALTLAAQQAAEGERWLDRATMLRAVLRGDVDDPEPRVLAGIDKDSDHLLLACRLGVGCGSARRLAPPVVRVAAALPASTTSFSDGDDLVVVCPTTERDAVVTAIRRELHGTDFVVGIAGPCRGELSELRSTWTVSRRTAAGLVALGMKGEVAHAADLGPLSLVLSAAQDANTLDEARAALSSLDQVPTRRARNIRLTMLTFLRQSQNMQRTAEELNVHVNTLYQRLATVDQLFGPDWRTAGRSLSLRLALEVSDVARHIRRYEFGDR
jgi:hypothetical protein